MVNTKSIRTSRIREHHTMPLFNLVKVVVYISHRIVNKASFRSLNMDKAMLVYKNISEWIPLAFTELRLSLLRIAD